jgi:hypothetical protein
VVINRWKIKYQAHQFRVLILTNNAFLQAFRQQKLHQFAYDIKPGYDALIIIVGKYITREFCYTNLSNFFETDQ